MAEEVDIREGFQIPVLSKETKRISLIVMVVFCLGSFIGIGLPSTLQKLHWTKAQAIRVECQLPTHFRLECLPTKPLNQYNESNCETLHCCWDNDTMDRNIPQCFHCTPSPFHYTVSVSEDPAKCEKIKLRDHSNASRMVNTEVKVLKVQANPSENSVESNPYYINAVKALPFHMHAYEVHPNRLMVKFFAIAEIGFEPDNYLRYGDQGFTNYGSNSYNESCDQNPRNYRVTAAKENEVFYLKVERTKNSEPILDIDFGALFFTSQYTELTIRLPTGSRIFGLGQGDRTELMHDLRGGHTWYFYNRHPDEFYSAFNWSQPSYGSQPFYLAVEPDGTAHGFLLAHSNIMEATVNAIPSVTFRSSGGAGIVFHVFVGPTPADVIRQLTDVVGKPTLPPYWSLGHHVCRAFENNYSSEFEEVEGSILALRSSKIPQESDCVFVSNQTTPWLLNVDAWNSTISLLGSLGIRLTLVHKPFVHAENTQEGVWIKDSKKVAYQGLWGGKAIKYVDCFKPEATKMVKNQIENYMDHLNEDLDQFSGFILTDNTGSDDSNVTEKCPTNMINSPPFLLSQVKYLDTALLAEKTTLDKRLRNDTICLDACHGHDCELAKDEKDHPLIRKNYHYNLHNLYGHAHAETVHKASKIINQGNRPFILSLSTFTGTGRYSGHWGGQVEASWTALKRAVIQMLDFNLYGIPMTGTPACGYTGEADRDLCSRWIQLSAFQPLSITFRHFSKDKVSPELQINLAKSTGSEHPFMKDELVTNVAASALQLRLTLLPYFYEVFYNASLTGDPVVRPLFYEWPTDEKSYSIDDQFMWGSALMVSPVLTPATIALTPYFPPGTWYDFYDGTLVHFGEIGSNEEVMAIEYHLNLHIRGGHIIPTQRARNTTDETRAQPYKIQVALEQTGKKEEDEVAATGQLVIDDGDGYGEKLIIKMGASRYNMTFAPVDNSALTDHKNKQSDYTVDTLYILGLKRPPDGGYCQKIQWEADNITTTTQECYHDDIRGVLSIRQLKLNLLYPARITWRNRDTNIMSSKSGT